MISETIVSLNTIIKHDPRTNQAPNMQIDSVPQNPSSPHNGPEGS